jgi:hypothetical protein
MHHLLYAPSERIAPRQQQVRHNRESILVRSWHWLPIPLFRGYVGWCSTNTLAGCRGGYGHSGHAEIREQDIWQGLVRTVAQQKIRRFHVLMNQFMCMSMVQRLRGLPHEMRRFFQAQRLPRLSFLQPACQRAFRAERHDHISQNGRVYLLLPKIVQRQNQGMIELSNHLHFAPEKPFRLPRRILLRVSIELRADRFDGNLAGDVRPFILRQVNVSHPSIRRIRR